MTKNLNLFLIKDTYIQHIYILNTEHPFNAAVLMLLLPHTQSHSCPRIYRWHHRIVVFKKQKPWKKNSTLDYFKILLIICLFLYLCSFDARCVLNNGFVPRFLSSKLLYSTIFFIHFHKVCRSKNLKSTAFQTVGWAADQT